MAVDVVLLVPPVLRSWILPVPFCTPPLEVVTNAVAEEAVILVASGMAAVPPTATPDQEPVFGLLQVAIDAKSSR